MTGTGRSGRSVPLPVATWVLHMVLPLLGLLAVST